MGMKSNNSVAPFLEPSSLRVRTKENSDMHRRALQWLLMLAVLHISLWLRLPSQNIHLDGLDELMLVEAPSVFARPRHPVAEPVVWVIIQVLKALGYEGNAIRPVQVWNGLWMTVALMGVYLFALRAGRSVTLALAAALVLGGCYSSLHLALDPYSFYWPPGLALMSWALMFCLRKEAQEQSRIVPDTAWHGWLIVLVCLTGAALFNPMCSIAIPLGAVLWLSEVKSKEKFRALLLRQGLGLFVLPFAVLLMVMWLTMANEGPRGPTGFWSHMTLREGWKGMSGALLAREEYFHLLGAMRSRYDFASLTTTGAVLLLPLTVLTVGLRIVLLMDRIRLVRAILWGVAVLAAAGFVLWWCPAHAIFWLLPFWLLVMGTMHVIGFVTSGKLISSWGQWTSRLVKISTAMLLLQGAAFWVANSAAYVVPAALRPNEQLRFAQQIARHFTPRDVLVFPVFQSLYIDYFEHIRTRGMVDICAHRRPGQSTFELLAEIMENTQKQGGVVYFEIPRPGEQWVNEYVRNWARVDYTEEDFARIRWGRTIEVEGHTFREALSVEPPSAK